MKENIKAISANGKYRITLVGGPCSMWGNDIYILWHHRWFRWKQISFTIFYSKIQKWLIEYNFGFDNYFNWLRPEKNMKQEIMKAKVE